MKSSTPKQLHISLVPFYMDWIEHLVNEGVFQSKAEVIRRGLLLLMDDLRKSQTIKEVEKDYGG